MAKRKNIICCMRDVNGGNVPRNGVVARDVDDRIHISWTPVDQHTQHLTDLTSRDARLLAKRINQFLDAGG